MNRSNILIILFSFIIGSCHKDWLDKKADKNLAVPSTLKDFQALLDFSFRMNNSVMGLGEIAADGHYVTEAAWSSATSNAARNAYTWSNNFRYNQLPDWQITYIRIFHANVVLDGLPKVEIFSDVMQSEWNNIKGQALFNRAISFFNLAQLYAQPYNDATAHTGQGIPLRLNSDVTEPSVRSSVKATYDQIINDTKDAIDLLPISPLFPTRGSKPAAYALLARVYLVMGDYANALIYADKCLQLKSTLMDYNSYSASQTNFGLYPPEVLFHDQLYVLGVSNFLTTNYLIDTSLYNKYAMNDLRRTLFFKVNSNGTITFKGNYNNSASNWFCGLATDEVYLIRAECYARKGDIVNAINALNALLEKRYDSSFVSYIANNADEALTKVLQERRKELVLRNLRWSDLRRLNNDNRFKVTLTRTIGGNSYMLEPNSYKYTFPFPDDVIQLSRMPQTIGW